MATVKRVLQPLVDGRTGRALIHLSLHLVVDPALWVLFIVLVAGSAGLAVTVVVGIPMVALTLMASHLGARVQRWRHHELLDTAIVSPALVDATGSWWRRGRRHLVRRRPSGRWPGRCWAPISTRR